MYNNKKETIKRFINRTLICLLLAVQLCAHGVVAAKLDEPQPAMATEKDGHIDGEEVFKRNCQMCHTGFLGSSAPSLQALAKFPPASIIHSLTVGVMRAKGNKLNGAERRAVAEYLSATDDTNSLQAEDSGFCSSEVKGAITNSQFKAAWNGWGASITNNAFQTTKQAGLTRQDLPSLDLKWAFGFPDSFSAWSQPVVVGGRLYVGSQSGFMYALDAKSGCILWRFEAKAGVRGAVNVGSYEGHSGTISAVYFGDQQGNVYGLDAQTGERLWSLDLEKHPKGRITGSPVLFNHRLYVPMSSWRTIEEPGDVCCTFRGSVSAVDVNSGKLLWKTYTIHQQAVPTGKLDREGHPLLGPAGSSVWQALTVDASRSLIYAGTGNSYTGPAINSDSILAFDMLSGEIKWSRQVLPNDIWVPGCSKSDASCTFSAGANLDFSTAPILATTTTGKQLIIVGNKSGILYALDPGKQGQLVWCYRAAQGGGAGGIVWGLAVEGNKVYVPISDITTATPGGLHALALSTGKLLWKAAPVSPLLCGTARYGCNAAQPSGLAVIPGVIFSGSVDGGIRAYSSEAGEILWVYDTNKTFTTVNGVQAHGGSLIGVGPSVVNGMLYVNSGYGTNGGRPGNVLLAFGIKE